MLQKMKICSKCKDKLPSTTKYFFKDIRLKDGLANPCKLCKKKYERLDHAKTMNHGRAMKYLYGITSDNYNQLFQQQKGHCAICGKHQSKLKRRLDIDHNHKTGKVRGLLCNYCNKVIEKHINNPSWFKNPIIVNRLGEYLK